ncbi:MAG: M3 family metallopeptidase [Planctomycetes bacterium]|nr:M3 family metallopeptidase [Planctomycetota bacterium]MCB9885037.1 M3 family metallopeptidase [Planctomycetota bacterium]
MTNAPASDRELAPDHPLLAPWPGPHGGVPPFDRVAIADFAPAIRTAMAAALREVDRIATDPAPATFDNTIAAFERVGRPLSRALTVYGVWSATMSNAEFQAVERQVDPELAAFSDKITQNERLFARIEAVHAAAERSGLSAEQRRLCWKHHDDFVRAGARLDAAKKARLSAINQELARLYTTFTQNVLAEETDRHLVLESEAELAGLSPSLVAAAADAAASRGLPGKWVIDNTRSSIDPFLTYAERRELREAAWRLFTSRADGGAHDNNPLIAEILALRAERAQLLGFATHAHWRLQNAMAKTPERAMELLEAVWAPAVARVHEEVADMQQLASGEGQAAPIAPWDYRFYAEKVRKQRYDLDQDEVKQYLQLDELREGMFWVAGELFGLRFRAIDDAPVYHPDVRVWEVHDTRADRHLGLWYFDPYARPGKRSGAWMNDYRAQERLDDDVTTIVSNNCNFVKAGAGAATLISWDDATTLFHEFGHALHGLLSNVTYPTLSGTNVARDFVEFPSQLLEHWLSTKEVLQRFARHHRTGAPIPQKLVDRLERAAKFNQGFATTEYLASALVDMKMHTAPAAALAGTDFERQVLDAAGMPEQIVMRHRPTHFLHVFSGDGYSAAYYSYLWADTIVADAWEAFTEAGGPYDQEVAGRLLQHVFSVGNTRDPEQAYEAFRGRQPRIDALMRKRGFPVAAG